MSGISIRLHAFARECKSNHDYLLQAFDYTSGLTTIGPLAANLFEQYRRGNASQNGGKSTCDANKEKVRVEAMGSSSETQRTSIRQELPEIKNQIPLDFSFCFCFCSPLTSTLKTETGVGENKVGKTGQARHPRQRKQMLYGTLASVQHKTAAFVHTA